MNPNLQNPQIITIANQKGGVGKTTTAINLATAFTAVGRKSLVIDLDPQGNASTGLGIEPKDRTISTYDVLRGNNSLDEAVIETAYPNLFLAPSTLDLLGLELEMVDVDDRAFKLKHVVERYLSKPAQQGSLPFSYIIVDCPPSLNLLTINALTASHSVLVPLQCEFFALEGLSQLLRTVERIKSSLNPQLSIQGIVLTMFDTRNNLANQVVADVRSTMGKKVYDTIIPRNVRVSEAPSHGKPVLVYDFSCPGSKAYIQLASEIIHRENPPQDVAA